MIRILKFWVFCCLQVSIVLADDIDADYFFGSSYEALRARDTALDCNNPVNQLYCKLKCKNDPGVCFENKCYCVYEPKPDSPKKSALIKDMEYTQRDGFLRYNPYRRHHIAHFCPNLDEARKCIRKCMKVGKPAFCGKDHVCYCGHKYSHHQKEEKLDPEKIKAGFYELYEKYFGPDTTIMKNESKEHDDESKNHNAPPKKDPPKTQGTSHEKGDDEVDNKDGNDNSGDTAHNEGSDAASKEGGDDDVEGGDKSIADEGNEQTAGEESEKAEPSDAAEAEGGNKDEQVEKEENNEAQAGEEDGKEGEETPEVPPSDRRYFRRKVYKFSI